MCNSLGLFILCTGQVQAPGLGEKMVGREEEAFLGFDNTQYTPKVQAAGLGEERESQKGMCKLSGAFILCTAKRSSRLGWGRRGWEGRRKLTGALIVCTAKLPVPRLGEERVRREGVTSRSLDTTPW